MEERKTLVTEIIKDVQDGAESIMRDLEDIDADMEVLKFLFEELADIGGQSPKTVNEACAVAMQLHRIEMLSNIGIDYTDKTCRLLTELIDRAHRLSRGDLEPEATDNENN